MNEGFFQSPQLVEKESTPVCDLQMTWVELQGMLKAQHGVGCALQLFKCNTKTRPKRRIVRPELCCLVECL